MKTIILDTRNQKDGFVESALRELGYNIVRSKLPFGDVALSTNILNCIDLKSSGGGLIELAKNICSKDHSRLKEEIKKCLEVDGNITFLCFEPKISSIEEIKNWEVPTFKNNLWKRKITPFGMKYEILHKKGEKMTKVKPETLMKAIMTMSEQDHYKKNTKINFVFTTKQDCGKIICKLLGE